MHCTNFLYNNSSQVDHRMAYGFTFQRDLLNPVNIYGIILLNSNHAYLLIVDFTAVWLVTYRLQTSLGCLHSLNYLMLVFLISNDFPMTRMKFLKEKRISLPIFFWIKIVKLNLTLAYLVSKSVPVLEVFIFWFLIPGYGVTNVSFF